MKSFQIPHRLRLFLPFVVISFGLLALFLRLIDLQIVQGSTLRQISEENRFFRKTIPAERGVFLDRFDKPLVFNKLIYYKIDNPSQLYAPQSLISQEEAMQLMVASPAAVARKTYRSYPYKEALSAVLGYIGQVTKEDLQKNTHLNVRHEIGRLGVERTLDAQLRGKDGEEVYELNAQGRIIRKVSQKPSQAGENIYLTLDAELSVFVSEQLKGVRGSIVVGDPDTGEILALASSPTFDANVLTQPALNEEEAKKKNETLKSYFNDPQKVFFNRAISGVYPPGSVFKPITALAGLEQSAFNAETSVVDEGTLKVNDFEYQNWYYRQYGQVEGAVTVTRALARSNDIFFYKAAEWLGPNKLATASRLFGLGSPTGIELGSEASGLVPDPAWKEKTIGEPWYLGNTYHFGIGQGDVLVTPLQVFNLTGVFANHGKKCTPHIVRSVSKDQALKVECEELGFSEEHLKTVWEGLVAACSRGGTGFPFFEWNETHENKVACKTGTAEFGGEDEKGYRKTHGWFTAVVEIPNSKFQIPNTEDQVISEKQMVEVEKISYPKKIVITVLVESDEEHPFREGSRDAAPIALEIVKWIEENR